ncbi:hypothetical protein GCM10011578_051030 [Streptomyces fuscichromogenes]|uniref:Uncharacterized protein n=1 Tax=Streptomyces fuscichromogenes TaxID=1324013 RepID=A0A917XFF4_9ACTN|nr:hypothetical protein GCM10011578_051030 [Streptomyces fuscichromogenes]
MHPLFVTPSMPDTARVLAFVMRVRPFGDPAGAIGPGVAAGYRITASPRFGFRSPGRDSASPVGGAACRGGTDAVSRPGQVEERSFGALQFALDLTGHAVDELVTGVAVVLRNVFSGPGVLHGVDGVGLAWSGCYCRNRGAKISGRL